MKQKNNNQTAKHILKLVVDELLLFSPFTYTLAANCAINRPTYPLIKHNMRDVAAESISYYELFRVGYVTTIVTFFYPGRLFLLDHSVLIPAASLHTAMTGAHHG